MNKEWSELNKIMQTQIRKKDTYEMGIDTLFELRNRLMKTVILFYDELNREEFNAIPFMNVDGYHSKTIAYSIWHIFRIEDIVAHTLINKDEQVFFAGNYQKRINSPIITTGNELKKQQIICKRGIVMKVYHVVTDRPMNVGQKIIFDENNHSGVYERVINKIDMVNEIIGILRIIRLMN